MLRVFRNSVMRNTFRPREEKLPGDWGKLHNEEIYYHADLVVFGE
jgi:hypothetical protein